MSRSEESSRRDYYSILGAEESAPQQEIERRYKRLAQKHHPDRGGDEEEMKSINEAYGVLGNEESRTLYDAGRRRERRSQTHVSDAEEGDDDESAWQPISSPSAQADALGGRLAGALLLLVVGLGLLLLVKSHNMWFLFPLTLLALSLIVAGIVMAHGALSYLRGGYAPTHPARRFAWAQEAAFWTLVVGGVYGVYLVLRAI